MNQNHKQVFRGIVQVKSQTVDIDERQKDGGR